MINYEAEEQIQHLSIEGLVSQGSEICVLDIACGREHRLFDYLRAKGVEVDGIDPKIPIEDSENDYRLIRRAIRKDWPWFGSIPRPAGKYDLVISHHNNLFDQSFTCFRDTYFLKAVWAEVYGKYLTQSDRWAKRSIREAMRVVKPEGIIVIYPAVDLIDRMMGEEIDDGEWKVVNVEVPGITYEERFVSADMQFWEDCSSSAGYRSVLYRNSSSTKLLEEVGVKI